jgi:SPP1 gp7 family putative phage head morphogenesis protein
MVRPPARNPVKTVGIERRYAAALRGVGREVGRIINGMEPDDPGLVPTVDKMMRAYSEMLQPWAVATSTRMLEAVNAADKNAWLTASREISSGLDRIIVNSPVGSTMLGLLAEQVSLIQSIPIEAAQRVHTLTTEAALNGRRAKEIAKEIQASGSVAESRATLIARTEVARTASHLTQARALGVGSTGYVWETSHDGDVRASHRAMQGKTISWDTPPTLDKMTGHAGQFPNCRCWPRVILPVLP